MLASAGHVGTCKDYRETKQAIEMLLIVKYDKTWVISNSILDERSVEFSASLKRRKKLRDTELLS